MIRWRYVTLLVLLLGLSTSALAEQDTLVSGQVSGRWQLVNTPFVFASSCTVAAGHTLIIDPGVHVSVGYNQRFIIYGRLVAGGAGPQTVFDGGGGPWSGIYFLNSLDFNQLNNCHISNSDSSAIVCVNTSVMTVDNCILVSSLGDAIRVLAFGAELSSITLTNVRINAPGQNGIFLNNGLVNATNTTITNAGIHGIYGINGSGVYLTRCSLTGSLSTTDGEGIKLDNSTSSGTLVMNECECSNNNYRGIWVNRVRSITLNYVSFVGNRGAGIYAQNIPTIRAYRVTASGNGISAPGAEGVFCYASNGSFNSCCFDNNVSYGIQGQATTGITVSNSNFFSNGNGPLAGVSGLVDTMNADPQWLAAANFVRYPRAGSRLIDAGDQSGEPDSDRTRADIGHHYFNQNHPPRFLTWTPTDTILSGAWGDQRTFAVTYADTDAFDTVRVKWYVDTVLAGTGPTFTTTYRQPAHTILVELNDMKPGGRVTKSWHVTVGVSEPPVATPDEFTLKSLYPDPTNGMITIRGTGAITGRWKLLDPLGRTVMEWVRSQPVGNWHYSMQLPDNLPSGRYWIISPRQKAISLILLK